MSSLLRSAAAAALTVAAACAVAGAANAQSYDRLVVFGDSLSDNGNLYAITGGAQPPAPFYWQGRFSTGPVFTEQLGFTTQKIGFNVFGPLDPSLNIAGNVNAAFGGAVTGLETRPGSPPGMMDQLNAYLARGGTFSSGSLVSVLGGANNIFQALPTAGASANPLAAISPVSTAAAADVNQIVNRVAQSGAGTVLVTNLPKLSITPQFRGQAAAPLADYAVTTFNTALTTGLAATAAARPNTNIIMMDIFKIGDTIIANPGAFGLTNVTTACFNQQQLTLCSTPDTYFYLDGVHPTGRGHQILAALADDYLYYGDHGANTTHQGETASRHRQDSLSDATDALSGRATWAAQTSISVTGLMDKTDIDARGVVGAARSDGKGVRMALESGTETLRFGMAGAWRVADVEGAGHSFTLNSLGLDVYAGFRSGDVFVNAAAGVSNDDYNDIERMTSLAPIIHSGSTAGVSKGARLQAGMWWDMGGLALSPRAAVTWVSSDVNGYVEQGVAAQLSYQDRTVDGAFAEISLRAEADLGGWNVYAEGGYRDSISDSDNPVRVGILSNTAQILSRSVDDPFGGQVTASAGLTGDMGPFQVEVGYRGRFGDHADSHMGAITLRLPL
ncbi:MAG: autotransporter domain-containing protein [Brevundimonas sp.]|uniref:autotransporter domain-containing protein n=1 Tax=Brevundimonas sp. TaxID=1871086 RepID=UPI0025C39603|nr:autotransporter domain-containing protein [Brevundimonas sp.]MBX3477892.1 autotransporter domain-containing protein [Brevundimonas sp.]